VAFLYIQIVEVHTAACPGVVRKGIAGIADDLSVHYGDKAFEILFIFHQLVEGDMQLFRCLLKDGEFFKKSEDGWEIFFGGWSDNGVHFP